MTRIRADRQVDFVRILSARVRVIRGLFRRLLVAFRVFRGSTSGHEKRQTLEFQRPIATRPVEIIPNLEKRELFFFSFPDPVEVVLSDFIFRRMMN